ncbi:MAG TPA: aminoglycoside phosphotransferase family protein [Hanamia sp.]|jgi:Ser/Thr protein kinase RdoA (MazF antagonist)|nr:aminoglycoside phosphotransferase family protein [Hanamia sp.]
MELYDEIISGYNLGVNDLDVEPIVNGLINATWRINNSHHSYILQKVNHHIFKSPESIASNVRMVADYLSKHHPGYFFVSPIQTRNGAEMMHIPNRGYFRLIPFVKDSHTINTVEKPQQAFEAAKKFGEFTRLLAGFPVEKLKITLPDFHNLTLRYQQFLQALETGNKTRLNVSKEYIQFIKEHKNIVDIYESILQNPSFKLRVTHHDTKISNVLFDAENKGLCVIDLDTLMPGYFISDVGDMVRTYLSPVNEEEKDFSKICIREEYFKSIWDGYMSEMKNELNDEERRHFIYAGKFMIYMQAIRFLTDHLNNDTYYGAKYEGQNFVRAGNQITLLKKLIEKENVLKSLIKR